MREPKSNFCSSPTNKICSSRIDTLCFFFPAITNPSVVLFGKLNFPLNKSPYLKPNWGGLFRKDLKARRKSTLVSSNLVKGSGKFIEMPSKLDKTSISGSMKGSCFIKEGRVNFILNLEEPPISSLILKEDNILLTEKISSATN